MGATYWRAAGRCLTIGELRELIGELNDGTEIEAHGRPIEGAILNGTTLVELDSEEPVDPALFEMLTDIVVDLANHQSTVALRRRAVEVCEEYGL